MQVLVAAASRHEATHEIAGAIAGVLTQRGIDAHACAIEQVDGLERYDAVVLGSAVYAGRWMKAMREFAQAHAQQLETKPVWLFSSGPVGSPDKPIPAGESADTAVLMRITGAREHRRFGGRLDYRRLSFSERALAHTVRAPESDCRDWDAIDAYAADVAAALQGSSAPPVAPTQTA